MRVVRVYWIELIKLISWCVFMGEFIGNYFIFSIEGLGSEGLVFLSCGNLGY